MKTKEKLALLVAGLLLVLTFPLSAAGSFADVTDPATARDVEILQMMGVLSGLSEKQFDPTGTLTRAQFTKMAVCMLNKGEQVGSFQSFTIFPDVKPSHWASGYINFAVRGEQKFISGFSDGTFGPERNISYGEAVTILMRLLGYKDEDVGLAWPSGYLNAASTAGLTEGLALPGEAPLSRAQAAMLFANLLTIPIKSDSPVPFGESVSASIQKDVILLSTAVKTDDGSPALETTTGKVKLAKAHPPTLLQGRRGTLLLDKNNEAWGFVPSKTSTAQEITVSSASAAGITDKDGKEHSLTADTKVYYQGKELKYAEIFVNLRSGTRVTLHFGTTGKVESLYVGDGVTEEAIVIDRDGAAGRLTSLTDGRKDYTIYRHGEVVPPAALRSYDVATYNAVDNEITITNDRLSGRYDNAYPNVEAPSRISLLGKEFTVLPSAISSLAEYKIGDQITLLLTPDAQVAGAIDSETLEGNAVGIAKVTGGEATVTLTQGLTLKGKLEGNGMYYDGQLVTVSSWQLGYLQLAPLQKGVPADTLDVAKGQYGKYPIAADVQIFERVSSRGPVSSIVLEDIRLPLVPPEKVLASRINDSGQADVLLLDNVSGNSYQYGISLITTEEVSEDLSEQRISLKTPIGTVGPYLNNGLRDGRWVGLAANARGELVGTVQLEKITGVRNSDWENDTLVFFKNKSYAVSDTVICLNRSTFEWVSLGVARAFGAEMTLYVDDFNVVRGVEVS